MIINTDTDTDTIERPTRRVDVVPEEDTADETTAEFWYRQECMCGLDADAVGAAGEH